MIPFHTIVLDKPRRIRFGMCAMVEFEQLTGIKLTSLDTESISIDVVSKLLWVMLKQDEPTLTQMYVNALVDEYCDNIQQVVETVVGALSSAFPQTDSPNATAGKGKTSASTSPKHSRSVSAN